MPYTLVALVAGTFLGVVWLTEASVIAWSRPSCRRCRGPDLSGGFLLSAIEPALVMRWSAPLTPLLTSLVADSNTRARHNPDRELLGRGSGTWSPDSLGGCPRRGHAEHGGEHRSGGWTIVSGIIAVGVLVAMVMVLGEYVAAIPNAVLAGILIKGGMGHDRLAFCHADSPRPAEHLMVMLLTLVLTVFWTCSPRWSWA